MGTTCKELVLMVDDEPFCWAKTSCIGGLLRSIKLGRVVLTLWTWSSLQRQGLLLAARKR